jgi:hypothetical protein
MYRAPRTLALLHTHDKRFYACLSQYKANNILVFGAKQVSPKLFQHQLWRGWQVMKR